jgi:hypothetical protein
MSPGIDARKEMKKNEYPAFRKLKDHQKSVGKWKVLHRQQGQRLLTHLPQLASIFEENGGELLGKLS